jgi:hypothetical protein
MEYFLGLSAPQADRYRKEKEKGQLPAPWKTSEATGHAGGTMKLSRNGQA